MSNHYGLSELCPHAWLHDKGCCFMTMHSCGNAVTASEVERRWSERHGGKVTNHIQSILSRYLVERAKAYCGAELGSGAWIPFPSITKIDNGDEPPSSCECGSERVQSPIHSNWCPKYEKE